MCRQTSDYMLGDWNRYTTCTVTKRNPRNEFRRNAAIDKKDFAAVEYLLRKGHRQLEIYSAPGITNIMT